MFAVSQFTTMPCSAAQDLELYAEAGVEVVELCESKFPEDRRKRVELAAEFQGAGIEVASVQAKVHSIFPDRLAPEPRDPAERLEAFSRSVEFWSEALEVPQLPFVLISGAAPQQNFRDGWNVAEKWIRKAAKRAEACGARIAFEPLGPEMMHFDSFVCGLEQGTKLAERSESASVGLVVDAWHLWQEPDLANRLERAAPRVFVAHCSDWPKDGPRCLDDRLLPGDGIIPLQAGILRPLRLGGFEGPFLIEALSDESLEGSLWKLPPKELMRAAKAAAQAYG